MRFERAGGERERCHRPHGMELRCLPDGKWFDPPVGTGRDRGCTVGLRLKPRRDGQVLRPYEGAIFRLRPARARPFNRPMPRKSVVPAIPAKPTGLTKPERSRANPKLPDINPEQFDLWGAFAASGEHGDSVKAIPLRLSKTGRRRGSRGPEASPAA